jgi:hypothetical protein
MSTNEVKRGLYALHSDELATVLAALRYYQQQGMGDPFNRSEDIHDIATNGGEVFSSLDDEGIDKLCESINHAGLSAGAALNILGDDPPDAYGLAALARSKDGELEVHEPTIVSHSDDGGAYVVAWMWVSDSEAGVVPDEDEAKFRNHYRHCGQEWTDDWSCQCNDRCPVCRKEIEPYQSDDLTEVASA